MVLLGLLLLAASVAAAIAVLVANTDQTTVEAFGQSFADVTLGGLFLIGCAVGALAILGMWMIAAGLKRGRRNRMQDRTVVKQTRTRADELEDENNELRSRLEHGRSATPLVADRHDRDMDMADRDMADRNMAERDTALTRDRDHDGIADRSETSTERTQTMDPVDARGTLADRDYDGLTERHDGGLADRELADRHERGAAVRTDRNFTDSEYADADRDGVADRDEVGAARSDRSVDTPTESVYPHDPMRDESAHDDADHTAKRGFLGRRER